LTLAVVFAVLSVVLISAKLFLPGQKKWMGIVLKTSLSALFMLLGVIGYFSSTKGTMALFFLLGLAASFIGDILLEIGRKAPFMVGVAFFGGGHLLYIAGYLTGLYRTYGGEGLKDRGLLLFAAVVLILMMGFAIFKLKIPTGFFGLIAGYMVVLSLMCAMAFLYAWVSERWIFAVIVGLFILSDSSLTIGLCGEKKRKLTEICCLYPYYASQLLLAFIITAL